MLVLFSTLLQVAECQENKTKKEKAVQIWEISKPSGLRLRGACYVVGFTKVSMRRRLPIKL